MDWPALIARCSHSSISPSPSHRSPLALRYRSTVVAFTGLYLLGRKVFGLDAKLCHAVAKVSNDALTFHFVHGELVLYPFADLCGGARSLRCEHGNKPLGECAGEAQLGATRPAEPT